MGKALEVLKMIEDGSGIPIKKAKYDKIIDKLMDVRSKLNVLLEELTDLVPEEERSGEDPASEVLTAHDIIDDCLSSMPNWFKVGR